MKTWFVVIIPKNTNFIPLPRVLWKCLRPRRRQQTRGGQFYGSPQTFSCLFASVEITVYLMATTSQSVSHYDSPVPGEMWFNHNVQTSLFNLFEQPLKQQLKQFRHGPRRGVVSEETSYKDICLPGWECLSNSNSPSNSVGILLAAKETTILGYSSVCLTNNKSVGQCSVQFVCLVISGWFIHGTGLPEQRGFGQWLSFVCTTTEEETPVKFVCARKKK